MLPAWYPLSATRRIRLRTCSTLFPGYGIPCSSRHTPLRPQNADTVHLAHEIPLIGPY